MNILIVDDEVLYKSSHLYDCSYYSVLSFESEVLLDSFDYLTKKMKTNEGEVPQYYVDDSHEAIIPPDEWEKVQKEFVRRKAMGRKYSGNSVFATKIVCGD